MVRHQIVEGAEVAEGEWVTFPGDELEGRKPKVMCPSCRERLRLFARAAANSCAEARSAKAAPPLCFECYRVDLARERALQAARNLNTASEARFQDSLPFEPINRARLERLRAERSTVRAAATIGAARFVDRRRHAQIAARHALERI